VSASPGLEDLLRTCAPQVLGAVLRRCGDFGAAEDAVQEAPFTASQQWRDDGVPTDPRAWLITVASRRLLDWQRRESARRGKEAAAVDFVPADELLAPAPDSPAGRDDALMLLFLCCHPSLPRRAQVALTLRAVGGLTTAEIARAFLVPETTMAQRITRAKKRIVETGLKFARPSDAEFPARLATVLEVLYLIFNEGYTATSGTSLHRAELTVEAIRLARQLYDQSPNEGEVAGLLALMLLVDARRPARTDAAGGLVPLQEQDRSRWNAAGIAEGIELVSKALCDGAAGPYQVQAAIAAVHDEAPRAEDTDWPQIVGLYEILEQQAASPVVRLNHAVAVAMVDGPRAGLTMLNALDGEPRLALNHRLAAVRAHLLELNGDVDAARLNYERAARATHSAPERDYLLGRAATSST
jgi:RNA polymerase sigma factor (sigma-70 family)